MNLSKADIEKNKLELTKKLFECYIDYLRVDLSNFFRNDSDRGRNIDVIVSFRDIFGNILFLDRIGGTLLSDIKHDLNELEIFTNKFLKKGKNLDKIKKDNIKLSCIEKVFENDENGENKIVDLFGELLNVAGYFRESSEKPYMKDFKNVYCDCSKINKLIKSIINKAKEDILNILKQSKDDKSNGFVQPVLEVHNAFSHLAAFFYQNNPEDPFKNIDKAKSHIYRAILDYYKILIRFSINEVKKKDILTESFYSIREQEFLFLGQNLEKKKITFFNPKIKKKEQQDIMIAYKILFETIDEILEHQS
ncbi:hypothetical protein FUB23_07480 [Campylobacter jejuni]|uniref:hypothetical protein n=1 Tax=Campylobacter jejuni TaxID=197 RepID=UPI000F80BAE2|nr:hypothetical protein [Campylobacter jejuni]ECP5912087.1 hypothetical protein [Campylobacter jejuni]RTI80145.1 hypothetical protein C3I09_04925 [Campylobacter jejuni]